MKNSSIGSGDRHSPFGVTAIRWVAPFKSSSYAVCDSSTRARIGSVAYGSLYTARATHSTMRRGVNSRRNTTPRRTSPSTSRLT